MSSARSVKLHFTEVASSLIETAGFHCLVNELKPLSGEIAQNYDQIADLWVSDALPRKEGIKQHERAIASLYHCAEDLIGSVQ